MLYILIDMFQPNNAVSHRLLGYIKAIDEMKIDIDVTVIFFLPDENCSKIKDKFHYIKIEYLWDKHKSTNIFAKAFFFFVNKWKFSKRLKEGDIIYTYQCNCLTNIGTSHNKVKCYAERTEHPKVSSGYNSRLVALSKKKYRKTLMGLDGLFVISTSLKDYFVSKGVSAAKIHIINMTVDPNRFISLEKQQVDTKCVAYCGTASNNKDGVDDLIKAFAIIAHQYDDIKLMIIGKTPLKEDEFDNFSLIERLGIKDKVIFTGIVESERMPQLLKNAEILALPRPDSLQAKCGFPTKLGEYLLTGNPVVVTKVGDIPKFLKHRDNALLANQRDPEDFAEKLKWALDNPVLAKQIGEKGRKTALRDFNNVHETYKMINVILNNVPRTLVTNRVL